MSTTSFFEEEPLDESVKNRDDEIRRIKEMGQMIIDSAGDFEGLVIGVSNHQQSLYLNKIGNHAICLGLTSLLKKHIKKTAF
jgi:hypothetical protein